MVSVVAPDATRIIPAEQMGTAETGVLVDWARACKAAARTVSLYPGTHPVIQSALARVSATAARLTAAGNALITVHPDLLLVDGRSPARTEPAIAELAQLLHQRLVGELRIERGADAEDWRALLLLLARAPEELMGDGGIGRAWAAAGRGHFEIREIDYAEVLRERAGGDEAVWDRIIAFCLAGDATTLDERALASLVQAVTDPALFAELLEKLQATASGTGSVGLRAAALLQLLRTAVDAARQRGEALAEQAIQTIAESSARLTPDMMLAVLSGRQSPDSGEASLTSTIVERMRDEDVASFVARSVAAEGGATERLAHAFEALVPDIDRKTRLLDMAHAEARQTTFGADARFEDLWQDAANMLMSYSDQQFVSQEYGRELTNARTQALEVERTANDPPDRVQAWLATLSDPAVRENDLDLLVDLLALEEMPDQWEGVAVVAAAEIDRRTLLGEARNACRLSERLVRELKPDGRAHLREAAAHVVERLASGPLVRHVVLQMRKADDAEVADLNRLCHTLGAGLVQPLAETLAIEENSRAIRRLRELLLGFGAAGRQSVERLKNSTNPAVRRTAIDLLRVFGGREALPELESMLDDADPQVQRESVRAIVQIGTNDAFAVLQRALVAGKASRETILQQLIALRDDKAIPLLCYVLTHTQPRGAMVQLHTDVMDALGSLSAHPESTSTLRVVLYRGEWWAPSRTATLRRAAAAALRRLGSPEAAAVLDEAAARGSRGVRAAARSQTAGSRPGAGS